MSFRIIKKGIQDTIQDAGRFGYRHQGVNPNGPMDALAAGIANILLGREIKAPVLELHFPAAQILFEQQMIICITGADFSPCINDIEVPMHHPIVVNKNTILKFQKWIWGMRCYLSFLPEPALTPWLSSYSTNLQAAVGGIKGKVLQEGDRIKGKSFINCSQLLEENFFRVLPWKAAPERPERNIECIIGNEWHWLTKDAQGDFQENLFQISVEANRMGYRLQGKVLNMHNDQQLISSAVSFGTVQLLPNGQLIVLMADHQTTGGYARVAQVISAHLPLLAQKKSGDIIQFLITDLSSAENKAMEQLKYLHQLQNACKFKMEKLLHDLL